MYLNYLKFIQGQNRTRINLFPVSLDQTIDADNEVRITDLFVDSLSIKDYGFRTDYIENGRPAYHPSDLLKLFIYGVPSTSQAPDPLFNYEFFRYNGEDDTYTSPHGQTLHTNGSWYKEKTSAGNIIWFKQYKTRACRNCPVRSHCTRSRKERLIHRSEYADYYERNRTNTIEKEHLYKLRQAIVEHPYGTIKRSRIPGRVTVIFSLRRE